MIEPREIICYLSIVFEGDWEKIYNAIRSHDVFDREEAKRVVDKVKCKYVTLLDQDYPQAIRNGVCRPPFTLFYYGDISLCKNMYDCLSVVGSRLPLTSNAESAEKIVSELAKRFTIVSGLASGIDAIAHRSAIKAGGKTIGILGCGIDYVYPKENFDLFQEMKENHLVLSEFYGDMPPKMEYFPFRNRLIAGMSWGTFVPEVRFKSGTYSTVAHAYNSGREVFLLPQTIDSETFNNRLIREGGILVENADDIFNEKNISF